MHKGNSAERERVTMTDDLKTSQLNAQRALNLFNNTITSIDALELEKYHNQQLRYYQEAFCKLSKAFGNPTVTSSTSLQMGLVDYVIEKFKAIQ